MTTGQDVVDLIRSVAGQWYYSNDHGERMDPRASGKTDCSGTVRWAYLEAAGIDVGMWTGDESAAGWEVARGHYPSEIPWHKMQPGDLILMTATYWEQWDFAQYLCHIEVYCGDGRMIGFPSGWGPTEKNAQSWMEAYGCITWMVRRVIDSPGSSSAAPEGGYHIHLQAASERGGVLPMVTDRADNAGDGSPILYLSAWVDKGTLDVQANDLPKLSNPRDISDTLSGAVGDGSHITKLRMYLWSPKSDHAVYYRVMVGGTWLPWMRDDYDTGGSGDDFAGNGREPIQRVEAYIGKVLP